MRLLDEQVSWVCEVGDRASEGQVAGEEADEVTGGTSDMGV